MLQSCSFRHPVPRLVYPLGLGNPQVDPQCSKKKAPPKEVQKKNHSVAFNPFLFHLCFTTSSAVRCNPFAHGTLPNRYACSVFYRCRQAGLVEFYFSGTQSPDWFIPHAWATPRWTPSFNGQPSKNKKKKEAVHCPLSFCCSKIIGHQFHTSCFTCPSQLVAIQK